MNGAPRMDGVALAVDGRALGTTLRGDMPGRFLRRHPARRANLARPGQLLRAGATLGLIAMGDVLLPVVMPEDGIVLAFLAGEGDSVGHGAALATYVALADLASLGILP